MGEGGSGQRSDLKGHASSLRFGVAGQYPFIALEFTDEFERAGGIACHTGDALDVACGTGRHAVWLAEFGWRVTAVDIEPVEIAGVTTIQANLEAGEYRIQPASWDLIVCWLYYQADLLPQIKAGVRPGGIVAVAGKTTGRFATSLAIYRTAFEGFTELASGEEGDRAFLIARYNK